MTAKKLQWKRIAKGDRLPCDSLLMKKDGTIPSVVSGAGVKVGQDAYYLPVEEIRALPKEKSEDERIRKEIIDFVKSIGGFKGEWIAWLEKKGEHDSIEEPNFFDDFRKTDSEVEQKPAEWEPQTGDTFRKKGTTSPTYHLCDKREDGITFGFVENREVGISGGEITIFALKNDYELVERPKSIEDVVVEEFNRGLQTKVGQKPAEWRITDEDMFRTAVWHIKNSISNGKPETITKSDILDWFESLKDRVQPQPKQEWSEDTQQWIDAIIKDYEGWYDADIDHRATIQAKINILKSLRFQSYWKPSEEQLTQLYYASNGVRYNRAILLSLLEQLRKLREE